MTDQNTDLATRDDSAVSVSEVAGSIFSKVVELASNPNTNPEMFDRLVAWQERERAAQAEEEFNEAMNAAQNEIRPVARTAENIQTKTFYAKLEVVDAAIRPIYLKHGFSVSYNTVPPLTAGNIRIECEVARKRHSKKYYREAPADTLGPKGSPVKTVLHGGASTETFLKRYAVCGAFNIVFADQDDDGVRGGMKFVTDEQCDELESLFKEAGRDPLAFLERMFGGTIHHINEIEQGAYLPVKNTLLGLIHQKKGKA